MRLNRTLCALSLALVSAVSVLGLSSAPARAADDGQTRFEPADHSTSNIHPWFDLDVNPGGRVRDRVTLENMTDERQSYDIYATDATTIDGAFALGTPGTTPTGVGAWLDVPVRKVVLGPGESRTFAFTMTVPEDATPGDHAGGLVAMPRATQLADTSSNVQLAARYGVGVRMYVTVSGAIHAELTIDDVTLDVPGGLRTALFGADTASVSYRVSNTGNVRLVPTANGTIHAGLTTVALPRRELAEMLPSGTANVEEKVDGLRWGSLIGRVRVEVTITADGADPVTVEGTVWRVPWLGLTALALLVTVVVGWTIRRRRTAAAAEGAPDDEHDLLPVP